MQEYFEAGEWPWVKTQELLDGWLEDAEEHITDVAIAASSAKVLPAQTILLALYGATVGQLGLLAREMTCNQACCAMIVNEDEAHYRYLYYQLLSHRKQLKHLATGAAQQNLSGGLVKSFELPFPSIDEQRAIAGVLGALDDKIEQNRRTARALERLARAIFRAWFVDFEPVKAKAAGAAFFPSMPQAAFDALPIRMVDSAIGPVPEGWEVSKVKDAASLSKAQVKPQDHAAEQFDHYSIPAFDAGHEPVTEPGEGIKSGKFVVVPGCVLVSKLNPRIPRVWLPDEASGRRQIASTEFLVLTPRDDWDRGYLYCQLTNPAFRDDLTQSASGTSNSHQRVRPDDFMAKAIVVPPALLRRVFRDAVGPMMEHIAAGRRESVKLAGLRDLLLPKLLSGEVRVDAVGAMA